MSRGSEAALLLGAHYPKAVRAVVAGVPSSVALCSPDCSGAAWTLHGRDLPFTTEFNEPRPTDQPDAVIPVERILGPVLLACGGRDLVWRSCTFAHAIVERRRAHGVRRGDTLSEFPLAGHAVGVFFPYEPRADHSSATFADDARALGKVWLALLAFLVEATASNAGR